MGGKDSPGLYPDFTVFHRSSTSHQPVNPMVLS